MCVCYWFAWSSAQKQEEKQPRDSDASPRVELVSARAHKHAFNISRLIARCANAFDPRTQTKGALIAS